MFTVIRNTNGMRADGYQLQWTGPNRPSWVVGPNGTCCWYKKKSDAVRRAAELNK